MQGQTKVAEVRVGKLAANIVGSLLTVLLCVVGVLIAQFLPNHANDTEWHPIVLLICLIVLMPVHELFHAIGLRSFAGVSWRDLRFGIMWRALMPYCHCTVPIPIIGYRRMALLPLWATGGASVIMLLAFPTNCSGIFAGIAVAACAGDIWVVVKLRTFANNFFVQDSPTEIGCDVLSIAEHDVE
jgi:hypothetical protein